VGVRERRLNSVHTSPCRRHRTSGWAIQNKDGNQKSSGIGKKRKTWKRTKRIKSWTLGDRKQKNSSTLEVWLQRRVPRREQENGDYVGT